MATIITQVNNLVDDYPTTEITEVSTSVNFTLTASLTGTDAQNQSLVSNISIQWQVSIDDGISWNNVSVGGDNTVSTSVTAFAVTPVSYYRQSTLTVSNITFAQNLYQYRTVVTYTGATNTPVNTPPILLIVDPTINITRQPGDVLLPTEGGDTLTTRCYKTADPASGIVKVEVGAETTALTQLNYSWEVNVGDPSLWYPLSTITNNYIAILKPGNDGSSPILELERLIFYNRVGFRCVITGVSEEDPVTSSPHYVYMEDVEVDPVLANTTYNIVEDLYGDIPNRDIYDDPIRLVNISAELDTARNTGLNGDLSIIFQRKDPGTSVWYDVGQDYETATITSPAAYTQFPSNFPLYQPYYYITPPLRRTLDDGARYRLKIESSALFDLDDDYVKTLLPYYSDEIQLNVYRGVFFISEPADASSYPNFSASYSVDVGVTSGDVADVTYQWQYNTQLSNTGWVNIPTGGIYSGVNTNLLLISAVPLNPTYTYFRCVVNVPNSLSSITSSPAALTIRSDYFLQISSLNDTYAREFDNITFEVTASSVSQATISYQWQRSTNYNPRTGSGTWSNISGQTTNTLNFPSAATTNTAYYRLRLTSFGGTVAYSNVAYLSVVSVTITVQTNIPTTISVLEGVNQAYNFECEGISSIGTEVTYQWQIRRSTDTAFINIGSGANNSVDTDRFYSLRPLDRISDNGARIRCKMSAEGVPFDVYTNECVVTVNRKFSYFADNATKTISVGNTLLLDLSPFFTGGTAFYMWQESTNGTTWTNLNITESSLVIPAITNAFNGRRYRCQVTLAGVNQIEYTRGATTTLTTTNTDTNFTLVVTLSVVAASTVPTYYSIETQKTGASIGTVVCVAKPSDYVNNASANSDDISQWQVSVSGSLTTSNTSSVVSSGGVYNSNKPSWASSSYRSPRWRLNSDRFKGYLEMRGQYLRASEFPELARMFGTSYGGTITGTYPNYSSTDIFRMPNLYAKKIMGTGNVNNNRGAVSVTPLFGANGLSGGDKNVPGTIGGQYNYTRSAQLPPGSPGVTGQPDGTAGVTTPETFALGSFRSSGYEDVNQFAVPTMSGSVSWVTPIPGESSTVTPQHNHTAVVVGYRESAPISTNSCFDNYGALVSETFRGTAPASGQLGDGPTTPQTGRSHGHTVTDGASGSFDMVDDAGMNISDTTLRMLNSSRQVMDNNSNFYLRNNEEIPLNSPYFRLKYLIKAY